MNSYIQRCKSLVSAVEKLSSTEVDEMFKLIHKRNTTYTRNNNGVFLNLSWLDEATLTYLEDYVKFCSRSHIELLKFESICDVLNSKHKLKISSHAADTATFDKKESVVDAEVVATENPSIEESIDEDIEESVTKISASARYAIFKKRYAKQTCDIVCDHETDLKPEPFVCSYTHASSKR
jgi:hypothetical protein